MCWCLSDLYFVSLQIASMKELPSYDDLNFFITVDKNFSNENMNETNEDGYVFKILNSLQSSQPQLIGKL